MKDNKDAMAVRVDFESIDTSCVNVVTANTSSRGRNITC